MSSSLYETFLQASSLTPYGDGTSPAMKLAGCQGNYISVGPNGEPFLLLPCKSATDLRRPPIGLRHLRVEYGVRYRVRTSSGVIDDVFVVISLRGDDLALAEPFCLAGDVLLAALPVEPAASDIDRVVRQLVEMMTALSLPSSKAVAGLWAELWLMSVASDRRAAVAAWHGNATDRFDFAFGTHFVEVKATEQEERNHEFAYEQLRRSETPIQIASLKLRRAQNGRSIAELVQAIQVGLSRELREKVVRNVFGSVGSAISESGDIRFDESFAEAHLRVMRADQVPVVMVPTGSPISAVRFRVNLDDSSLSTALVKPSSEDAFRIK